MRRAAALISGILIAAIALGPATAGAQPVPENGAAVCHDGFDNDGNGYVDCNDPACEPFCPDRDAPQNNSQYEPPPPPQYAPPQYAPPPPQYAPPQYAPPSPLYYPTPYERPPPSGRGMWITGAVLLPIGLIMVGGSVPLWLANDPISSAMGFALDFFGGALVIVGAVLIPVGLARYSRYRAWQQSHGLALFERDGVRLDLALGPAAAHAPGSVRLSSGTLGLRLTF